MLLPQVLALQTEQLYCVSVWDCLFGRHLQLAPLLYLAMEMITVLQALANSHTLFIIRQYFSALCLHQTTGVRQANLGQLHQLLLLLSQKPYTETSPPLRESISVYIREVNIAAIKVQSKICYQLMSFWMVGC